MADARRFIALGMVPPLANELAFQIDAAFPSAARLIELSAVAAFAREVSVQITGTASADRLVACGVAADLAVEIADQIAVGGVGAALLSPIDGALLLSPLDSAAFKPAPAP